MDTKYEVTFTADNQVIFRTDLTFDDATLTDIPPTILALSESEKTALKDAIILAMIYSKFEKEKLDTLIDLNKKVRHLVL